MYNDLRGSCFFRRRKDVFSRKCSVILNRVNSSLPYASNMPYVVSQIFADYGKFSGIKKKERNKSAVILCNKDFVQIFFFNIHATFTRTASWFVKMKRYLLQRVFILYKCNIKYKYLC